MTTYAIIVNDTIHTFELTLLNKVDGFLVTSDVVDPFAASDAEDAARVLRWVLAEQYRRSARTMNGGGHAVQH